MTPNKDPRPGRASWMRSLLVLGSVVSLVAVQSPLMAEDDPAAVEETTSAATEAAAADVAEAPPSPEPSPQPPPPEEAGSGAQGSPSEPAPADPAEEGAAGEEEEKDATEAAPAAERPTIRTPWIESDQDDYAPGAMVTLTSGNWQPGERVHLVVNDDEGQTWRRDVEVTAAEDGRFADLFELPAWFVATYSVVATGEVSGVARTSFTDAVVANASVDVKTAFRNTTGNTFVVTVNNVSTLGESLGSVLITEPGGSVASAMTITGCGASPAGWTGGVAATACTFNSGASTADNIPAGSSATFTITASLTGGDNVSTQNWAVRANVLSSYAATGSIAATASSAGALGLELYTYRITDAVIATASTTVGQPCPSANKSAPAASSRVIVICGVNGRGATESIVSGQSSVGGSMVGAPGTFLGGTAANTTSVQVLANWPTAIITGAVGAGKQVVAKVGGSSSRTSPSTALSGYESLDNDVDPAGSVLIDVLKTNDADETTLPGDDVEFTVKVTNNGTTKITITKIVDSFGDPPTEIEVCDGVGPGTPDLVGTSINPSAFTTCTFTLEDYAPAFGTSLQNTIRVEASSLEPLGKFLVADEDTIENTTNAYMDSSGTLQPWSSTDVNDGSLGSGTESGPNAARRTPLDFFVDNVGMTITVPAGLTSDPGLYEITGEPRTTDNLSSCSTTGLWKDRGPTDSGLRNFIGDPSAAWPHGVGPGLGTGSDPEKCLDKVPYNPLDSVVELQALVGQTVCIVAKDSDVSGAGTNLGNFQGGYLGVAAFYVNSLLLPTQPGYPAGWSQSLMAGLNITILDAAEVCGVQAGFAQATSLVSVADVQVGSLNVVKAFDGTGQPPGDAEFTIEVDCDGDDFDTTLVFDATGALIQGTLPITDIPAGTECTIDETDDGGADGVAYDPAPPTVTIATDQTSTVTVTNTFAAGTIQLVKEFSPSTDPGTVDLFIKDAQDGTVASTLNAEHGGSTQVTTVTPGDYTVSEVGSSADLSDYTTEISCLDAEETEVASGSDTSLSVPVADGDAIVCTITNTRKTGSIEVIKQLEPAGDPGLFDLFIKDDGGVEVGGTTEPVGDEGSTGPVELPTGAYTVGEVAGAETSLEDYDSSTVCGPRQAPSGRVVLGVIDPGELPAGSVVLSDGDDIVCTITNTRKTGSIELVKDTEPDSAGAFNLLIEDGDGAEVDSELDVGDGSTGPNVVPTGTYQMSETAGTDTSLVDFATVIACADTANGDAPVAATETAGHTWDVAVADGQVVVCTITNTQLASITVSKVTDPADAGASTFAFSATSPLDVLPALTTLDTDADDATFEDSETFSGLLPGSYQIAEEAGPAGWTLDDLTCTGGGGNTESSDLTGVAAIGLDAGENVDCVWSNVRTPLSGTVDKTNDADEDETFGEPEEALEEGQDVTFQLIITNTSPVPVTIDAIEDTFDGVTISITGCLDLDSNVDVVGMLLAPAGSEGDSVTCRFTLPGYAPEPNGEVENTVGVRLVDELGAVTLTDPSTVTTAAVLPTVEERPPGRPGRGLLALATTGGPLLPLLAGALALLMLGLGLRRAGRRETS